MNTKYTVSTKYTNETSENVLLANGTKILAIGDMEIKSFWTEFYKKFPGAGEDLGASPYSVIETVKPGETVEHTFEGFHFGATSESSFDIMDIFAK